MTRSIEEALQTNAPTLTLSVRGATSLPAQLSLCQGLRSLSLSGCEALRDVSALSGLTGLHSLDLSYCRELQDVSALSGLTGLHSLDLNDCRELRDVSGLSGLTDLRSLALSGCVELRDVSVLSLLTGLEWLNLSGCSDLQDVSVLSGLKDLQWLNLSFCRALRYVPELSGLTGLRWLNLSCCVVLRDVSGLSGLTGLQWLNLCDCRALRDVSGLSGLTNLVSIDLFGACPLNCLPGVAPLSRWRNLETLIVSQLVHAPQEICSQGLNDNALPRIRAWQQALAAGEAPNSIVKVFILGNGEVGKTQLCRRLCGEAFDETIASTHGIAHRSFSMPPPRPNLPAIDAKVWDFGGQDIYLGTHALFLDHRAIYVIAWNPRFENDEEIEQDGVLLRNRPLGYWIEYVHSLAGSQVPVIVVQTQCERERDVRAPPLPKHPFERLKPVSSSAKAPDGVDELQFAIKRAALSLLEEYGKVRLPATWVNVRDALDSEGRDKTLSLARFDALCRAHDPNGVPDVILEYLHRSGQVFWHEGVFNDQIVIDQAWAFAGIYALLERNTVVPRIRQQSGRFTQEQLAELVWRSYSPEEQQLFLSMMEQCEACFEVLSGQYIAPAHLPAPESVEETQVYWQDATADVVAELQYEFLHEGVLRAMLCGIGRHAGVYAAYWAYGTCFYDVKRRTKVLITSTLAAAESTWGGWIRVEAAGAQARELVESLVLSIQCVRLGRPPTVVWRPENGGLISPAEPVKEPFKVHAGMPEYAPMDFQERIKSIVIHSYGDIHVGKNQIQVITNSPGAVAQQGTEHTLSNNTVVVDQKWARAAAAIDLDPLVTQLAELQSALKNAATDQEQFRALVAVGDAEIAAKKKDRDGVFRHLKAAGSWALDLATKMGTSVAAKAIEVALNLK